MNNKSSLEDNELQSCLQELLKQPIKATTYWQGWRTKSNPVLLKCADGKKYVVKGKQAGRQIVNDQIVARLGLVINASVGNPQIINISQELILDSKFRDCNFTSDELKVVYDILNKVTDETIVRVVAFPREDWGITFAERLAMINYLIRRKEELQHHLKSRLGLEE